MDKRESQSDGMTKIPIYVIHKLNVELISAKESSIEWTLSNRTGRLYNDDILCAYSLGLLKRRYFTEKSTQQFQRKLDRY